MTTVTTTTAGLKHRNQLIDMYYMFAELKASIQTHPRNEIYHRFNTLYQDFDCMAKSQLKKFHK